MLCTAVAVHVQCTDQYRIDEGMRKRLLIYCVRSRACFLARKDCLLLMCKYKGHVCEHTQKFIDLELKKLALRSGTNMNLCEMIGCFIILLH